MSGYYSNEIKRGKKKKILHLCLFREEDMMELADPSIPTGSFVL